jgi:hypothetical protein
MSKTLGIRLNEETEEMLDSLSETMNLKKSQLLKRAFREWVMIKQSIQRENMILCDRLLLAFLFKTLPDDEICQIAETMSEHIISIIRIRQIERGLEETIEEFLQNFTRFNNTQHSGWFQKMDYTLYPDGKISIYGFHSLNQQYSKYASELITRIISKKFGYEPTGESPRVTENSIILEYKPG